MVVEDVSATECYDLRCKRTGREVRVEVKGTTGSGMAVLLTRNEVEHAKTFPDMVLFVVSEIELSERNRQKTARKGKIVVYDPWHIDAARLEARTYSLALYP